MLYRAVFYRSLPKIASRIGYDLLIITILILLTVIISNWYPYHKHLILIVGTISVLLYGTKSTVPLVLLLFRRKPLLIIKDDGMQFDFPYYQRAGFTGFIEWTQIISSQLTKFTSFPPQRTLIMYIFDIDSYILTSSRGPVALQRPSKSFSIIIPDILTISLKDLKYIVTSETNSFS